MSTSLTPKVSTTWIVAGGLLGVGLCCYAWMKVCNNLQEEARLRFLADAPLKSTHDPGKSFKAGVLWQEKPIMILALRKPWCPHRHDVAAKVSTIVKPELDKRGINLCSVTGDTWLVSGLHRNLKGEVFLDIEQRFFQSKVKRSDNDDDQFVDGIFIFHGGNLILEHQAEDLKTELDVDEIIRTVFKFRVLE